MVLSVQYYELPHPGYLDLTLRELKIGTYENIATVSIDPVPRQSVSFSLFAWDVFAACQSLFCWSVIGYFCSDSTSKYSQWQMIFTMGKGGNCRLMLLPLADEAQHSAHRGLAPVHQAESLCTACGGRSRQGGGHLRQVWRHRKWPAHLLSCASHCIFSRTVFESRGLWDTQEYIYQRAASDKPARLSVCACTEPTAAPPQWREVEELSWCVAKWFFFIVPS